jgi:Tol biopolymer transport system component
VTNTPARLEFHPAWSPQGDRIVFHAFPADLSVPQVYVISPDGTGEAQLTFTGGNSFPDWQPLG